MDSLLADTDIEESLSFAYVHAVAVSAGYVVSLKNFDRDGIDMTIEAGDHLRPKIDVQLKSTINLDVQGSHISYACRQRNYDLLRIQTQTPRILIVMRLPKEKESWVEIGPDELVLRHSAYWICLTDAPETKNTTSTTISIPTVNVFNSDSLRDLMFRSRTGSLK